MHHPITCNETRKDRLLKDLEEARRGLLSASRSGYKRPTHSQIKKASTIIPGLIDVHLQPRYRTGKLINGLHCSSGQPRSLAAEARCSPLD